MKVIIIIICIFFSVAFANRNAWQRLEVWVRNPKASKKWHLWEWLVKLSFALLIATLTESSDFGIIRSISKSGERNFCIYLSKK